MTMKWATSISLLLVAASLATLTLGVAVPKPKTLAHNANSGGSPSSTTATADAAAACSATLYPASCLTALQASLSSRKTSSKKNHFDKSVQYAMTQVRFVRAVAYNLTLSHRNIMTARPSAMDDCLELLDITLDQLNTAAASSKSSSSQHDVATWLSAALTNQQTCSESLGSDKDAKVKDSMMPRVQSLAEYISNSLALYSSTKGGKSSVPAADKAPEGDSSRYPGWMTVVERKLLEASPEDIRADAVVAQDGSGTHRSIGEALAFVSLASSGGRSVIYVKAGTYKENINIPTKQKNVMLMGDGKGKSVIVSNRNAEDGWSTYRSATVAAMGAGFIGKGLTIINNSGPQKQQAVALRVGADQSVVYQCSIQGYQDTLYTHSNRQFYRDNDIYGTVDFIFGNSAAVFQNCYIQPRKPGGGQRNSITAQGRLDPNQNTGISIQGCKIECSSDLGGTPTYLGRPWHKYSRTVFMQSYLAGCINRAGWEEWSGSFALSTLYYAEYGNTGPGASTSGRVRWPGVHTALSTSEAAKFTVAEFIFGNAWLPGTGVTYSAGL
ncbi:pectinesterase-like [Iris pallida]|uniref:Pectinesterase n=1 Tax=Iris pallida TaxID=29817 RepID=A0AAX6GA25_IRIPA|nr:pectinesterase-like [Iris pallida]